MFCQNCGKQNPDGSVFCDGCGAQIGAAPAAPVYEAPAQAPTYAPPAQPVVNYYAPQGTVAVKPAGNGFGKKLMDTIKGALKTPKATAAATANQKEGMGIASILAGANALAIFLFIWRFIGAYITKAADLADEKANDWIEAFEITYPILPMLLAGLLIAVIGIAVTAVAVFLINKLNKQESNMKQLIVIAAVNSLPATALMIAGTLLSFLTWWFFTIVLIAIAAMGIANICGAVDQEKNTLVQTGVIAVALMVAFGLTSILTNWSIGELASEEVTLNQTREERRENYEDNKIDYPTNSIVYEMLNTFLTTEVN